MKRISIGLLLATTALVACGQTPTIPVAQQWGTAIGQLDLIPLYPVQEDVQPGDVFLLGLDGQAGGTDPGSGWKVRVGQIRKVHLLPLLNGNYGERLSLVGKDGKAISSDGDNFVDSGPGKPPTRLRMMALPDVSVAKVSNGSIAGGGLLGALSVGLGLNASAETSVDISIQDVAELHIGGGATLAAIRAHEAEFIAHNLKPTYLLEFLAQRDRGLAKAACDTDFARLDTANISLLVANEIVYAKGMNFSYSDKTTLAGRLSVSSPAAAGAAAGSGSAGSGSGPAPAAAKVPTLADEVAAAQATLSAMAKEYGSTSPGVGISFGVGRSGNMTLKQTWPRPLAVGIAGSIRYSIGDVMGVNQFYRKDPVIAADIATVDNWCKAYNAPSGKLAAFLDGSQSAPAVASTGPKFLPKGVRVR